MLCLQRYDVLWISLTEGRCNNKGTIRSIKVDFIKGFLKFKANHKTKTDLRFKSWYQVVDLTLGIGMIEKYESTRGEYKNGIHLISFIKEPNLFAGV